MMNGNEIIKKETMTSLEIAEVTGRNHKDVMRSIREMEEAWVKVNGRKFALVEYKDAKGEMRPCYSLSKTECLYIATKFNDEARAKLILRWEELEIKEASIIKVPTTFAEALRLAADQAEKLEAQEKMLEASSKEIGEQRVDLIEVRAKQESKNWSLFEYKAMIDFYQKEVDKLLDEKHLTE